MNWYKLKKVSVLNNVTNRNNTTYIVNCKIYLTSIGHAYVLKNIMNGVYLPHF